MTLPGFSAEASLDRAVGCYRTSVARPPGHPASAVFPSGRAHRAGPGRPQAPGLFRWCEAYRQECYLRAFLCHASDPQPGFPSFCDLELWSCLTAVPPCGPYWTAPS